MKILLAALSIFASATLAFGESSPGVLLEEAVAAYAAAERADPSRQLEAYRGVRDLLDRVVEDHPASDEAISILLSQNVSGVDVAMLDAFLSSNGETAIPKMVATTIQPSAGGSGGAREIDKAHTDSAKLSIGSEVSETALSLSRSNRREVQRRLLLLGHNPNGVDGIFGPGTRGAISRWQVAQQFQPTGYLSSVQLDALKSQSDAAYQNWVQKNRSTQTTRTRSNGWYRDESGMYCKGDKRTGNYYCQLWKPRALR